MSGARLLERPDGTRLVWERFGPADRPTVVVTHGIFSYREMRELGVLREALLAAGYSVVLWDVRGHGDSTGRFTWGIEEPRDLAALVEVIRAEQPGSPLLAIGFSFGAFHSLLAAAEGAPFERLVLVGGPRDFRGLAPAIFGGHFLRTLRYRARRPVRLPRLGWPLRGQRHPREVVAGLAQPLLFVHGTADWIVPARHSEDLARLAGEGASLRILEGGLHAEYLLAQEPERFMEQVLPWLAAGTSRREG
ncbi:MAG: alpha/beta fold hydrolase [Deltaproteobacteria bacterium]|nr:alpha/beta fold hydrolase [Deltaproteobacteria bacterium]